jgi:uncharacterized protein
MFPVAPPRAGDGRRLDGLATHGTAPGDAGRSTAAIIGSGRSVQEPRRAARMKCPRCQVDLTIADRQGVEIDFCPQCRGVWLDRGELDKVIERASRYAADDDDDRWRGTERPRDYDRDHYYKKRKSFWTELFD